MLGTYFIIKIPVNNFLLQFFLLFAQFLFLIFKSFWTQKTDVNKRDIFNRQIYPNLIQLFLNWMWHSNAKYVFQFSLRAIRKCRHYPSGSGNNPPKLFISALESFIRIKTFKKTLTKSNNNNKNTKKHQKTSIQKPKLNQYRKIDFFSSDYKRRDKSDRYQLTHEMKTKRSAGFLKE